MEPRKILPNEIVRRAITTAYCMDFDTYCEVFGLREFQMDYAQEKWEKQQKDFGAWYCDLDSGYSKIFMDYVLREK